MASAPLTGLFLVGSFLRVEQVAKRGGELVPGFFRLVVDVGTQYPRNASFSEMDRETYERTRIHEHLEELNLRPGEQIAVRVVPRTSGAYVNLDAVQVIPLDRSPGAAAAPPAREWEPAAS